MLTQAQHTRSNPKRLYFDCQSMAWLLCCLCRCLYPPACEQATTGIWMQHAQHLRDSFESHSNQAFLAAQCAVGHEGPLCSRCSAGYGQSMLATVGKCQRCASAAQIIMLYLLAALATLLLINLLCYLNSGHRGSNQPSGANPTNGASGASPWLHSSSQPAQSSQGSGVPLAAGVGRKTDQDGVVHVSSSYTSASGQGALAASGTPAASTPGAPGPGEHLASEVLKCFVIYMQVCIQIEQGCCCHCCWRVWVLAAINHIHQITAGCNYHAACLSHSSRAS